MKSPLTGDSRAPVVKKLSLPADLIDEEDRLLSSPKSYSWILSARYKAPDEDCARYDLDALLSWQMLTKVKGSAFEQMSLWHMVICSTCVAFSVACLVCFTPHATAARITATGKLSTFLNAFMGMLLGFFLSSSVKRWYQCAGSFLSLLDAVRNLQMQCFALGVPRNSVDTICRYGILSARLLYKYHYAENKDCIDTSEEQSMKIWDAINEECPGLVLETERAVLQDSDMPYGLLWTWVASLVGRMAQDGEIPPMASPTYGRCLELVQSAHASIREVREFVTVQIPYIYTHTLALLVHFNNVLNAINLGVSIGLASRFLLKSAGLIPHHPTDEEVVEALENVMMTFFMSLIAPMLYHTLLVVGFCFAQPLSNERTRLPVDRFLKNLEQDLHEAAILADNPPDWERPCFSASVGKTPASIGKTHLK